MTQLPEAVTFDFHNTIARCDEWFRVEVYDLLPEFLQWHQSTGASDTAGIDPAEAVRVYRRLRGEIMDHGKEKDAEACVEAVLSELGHTLDRDVIRRGVRSVMQATLPGSMAIDGVAGAVRHLQECGIKLGVVSSAAYHPFLEWSLEKFGIADAFSTVVTSASCGFYKSRPEIYEIALQELGAAPDRSVHVGDSLRFDVTTAGSIGMTTVLFDPNREAEDAGPASAVVHTLVGVEDVILRTYRVPAV